MRSSLLLPQDFLFHVSQTVLAKEKFIANQETGRTKRASLKRAFGVGDQFGLHVRFLCPGHHLACIQSLNAASAGRDASRPLPERDKRSEDYARHAIALLKRAAAAGYLRDMANVAQMDGDADLMFLRDRDDFRAFRKTLQPAKP